MYGGHTIVTAFGHEAKSIATFEKLNEDYYDGAWRAQFVTGIMFPVTMFVGNLGYVAVAVMGGYLVTRRAIAIGDVQAFIQYSRQFTMPISQLSSIANTVQLTIASAERVFELLDEAEEPADSPRAAIPAPRGAVRFEDVAFRYKPEVPLIEEMNLTVTPGQTIAIVGPTGAGKSTLVNLVPRLFDVTAGELRVDGVDVRRLAPERLWSVIGLIPQRAYLFSGTVRSNLMHGKPDATDEEMWAALEIAQAADFVREMGNETAGGLDAPIAQGGTNVSGGQRQRLAIARAVVKRPEIYLFDDSFSALDLATDARLRAALRPVTREATVLIVAQRVSTIRDADVILVLEDGVIVDRGTHQQLLATSTTYQEIVASQLSAEEAA